MYQVVQVLDCVLISASKNQTVYFRDCFDLYKTIHFSRRTRMLVWILFRNIWHLYWNTGYLSKNNFGIFEKKTTTKGYGIFGVNYFGNGILGPPTPPYPTKTNLHDIPSKHKQTDKIQTSPDHLAWPNRKSRTSGTMLGYNHRPT